MKEYDTWANLEAAFTACHKLLRSDLSPDSQKIANAGIKAMMELREEIYGMMDSFIACQADNEKLREQLKQHDE